MVIVAACEATSDLVQAHGPLTAKMGSIVTPSLLEFAHHKSGQSYQLPAAAALYNICQIAPCKATISALLSIHGVKSDKHERSRVVALCGLAIVVQSMPQLPLLADIIQAAAKVHGGDKAGPLRDAAKDLLVKLHARFPDESKKGLDDAVRNGILDRKKAVNIKVLAEQEA